MIRSQRTFRIVPSLPPHGIMPPIVGVILPLARTNLVTNPSIETATTGYTAVGGSIARSATKQYHGTYSLAITPSAGTNSDGAFYGTVSLTSGTPYAYSCKVLITGDGIGRTYALSVATTGGTDIQITQFTATGRWQWIRGVYGETSSTTRRIYLRKVNHSATSVFYLDGLQVESCADGILDATTYIDGDQPGLLVGQTPPAYLWAGTPHASTSTRSALTRAGGYVVNLSVYNFILSGMIGLGMAAPLNISIPYTVLDGARYQRTQKPPRAIALSGRVQAEDYFTYMQSISDLRQAFDRDLVPVQQPLVLTVEPQDDCGNVIGDFAQIQCVYAGGLEGNTTNLTAEDITPTFTMYLPYLVGGDAGTGLTVQGSVTNANRVISRSPTGAWSALSTGTNGIVYAIAIGPDGSVYVGGDFLLAGGIANTVRIAKWDGSAWSALGTGMDAQVNALAFDAAGNLYAGGTFTTAGGVAANRIAKWNGSVWAALGTGLSGGLGPTCNSILIAPNGTLYAGGDFTDAGGSGADYIASWNGSTWSTVGGATAMNGPVLALANNAAGTIYAGGSFTNAGGVADADRIAKWNGTAWSSLSTGMDAIVNALAVGPNNTLYAGGTFTTAGGVSVNRIAKWNGAAWSPLGSGVNNTVTDLGFAPGTNILYASGLFTTAGGVTLPDSIAAWNGSTWIPLDVDLPSTATAYAVTPRADGALFLGFDTSGTATSAAVTTATNATAGFVFPTLVINGPSSGTSRIYQIVNYTTGFGVWLNLTLSPGEVATLNFDPQNPSFTTTFQGDITSKILPGSQSALLYLAPGANSISFFAASSTVTATLRYPNRYNGLADLVN